MNVNSEKSVIEMLPKDILVKIVSGVEHEDLKSLFHVSKSLRKATLIAKQMHFAYRTPKKNQLVFLDTVSFNEWGELEAPDAPKQQRIYFGLKGKTVDGTRAKLFEDHESEK